VAVFARIAAMHSVVPGYEPTMILDPPPMPVLHRVLPSRWWSQDSWPDPNWRSGMNWNFVFVGDDFVPGESVVLLGTKAVPCSGSRHELIAWVVPPPKPVTLPIRIRTGFLVSSPIPFTFR
jgi:hypothetical protein